MAGASYVSYVLDAPVGAVVVARGVVSCVLSESVLAGE